jgi:4-hydroxy-3-methylbut-2-en-1-yl diphosphate reductase
VFPAYLINSHHEIDPAWLEGVKRLGITSGASVPDKLVQEAAAYFAEQGAEISTVGFVEENIHFALPVEVAQ